MTIRIEELYQNYINSREFDKKMKGMEFDISWLNGKISDADMFELEDVISRYQFQSGKEFFESGFLLAWQLFKECETAQKVNCRLQSL